MSVRVKAGRDGARRRRSIYVEGYGHANPIPAACQVDNIVYSGLITGTDGPGGESATSLEQQAELMFTRMRMIVDAAGGDIADVIKVTIWMRERGDRERINRFWLEIFPDPEARPARQTFNAKLDGGQLIQCDFVAVLPAGTGRSGEGQQS